MLTSSKQLIQNKQKQQPYQHYNSNEKIQQQHEQQNHIKNSKSNKQIDFVSLDLKLIIKQLKERGGLNRPMLESLLNVNQNIFKQQSNVINVISPVVVVGDIHGQFFDLLNIFELVGFPENKKFLFLGDYVDRGLFCVEVITLLFILKVKYPKNIFLLRGNHEGRVMTSSFNFRLECQKKYGIDMYERFLQLFCKLPLCAVVDQTYFAVHGGISPDIIKIKQLQKVNRFVDITNKGIICDLVWSDPSQNTVAQWQPNALRGCSYYYSKIQAKKFLKDNQIQMIIRGHEVQMEGFNYQKTNANEKLTLTIFSAPNYCDSYKNKGAVALISPNKVNIQRYSEVAHPFMLANYMDLFQFSIPGVSQLVGKLLLFLLKNRNKKSKRECLMDDKLLQQLNALKRIQVMQQVIQQWKEHLDDILLQTPIQQKSQKSLMTSYQLAMSMFIEKKVNDCDEMYPTEQTRKMRDRKRTCTKTLKAYRVFGPKLEMKNNICQKKLISLENDNDDISTIQE